VGDVFGASEEAEERAALLRDVVADSAAEHGIGGLERVEDVAKSGRAIEVENHFGSDVS
jgi:hypothetical protein